MNDGLRERVAAGYGQERFTVPLEAIGRRGRRLKARNRLVALATGAILIVAATLVMGGHRPAVPMADAPSLPPLLAPALEAACRSYWLRVSPGSPKLWQVEQTEQPPPVIMQRVAGTRGISLHYNGHIGFACVVKDGQAPTGGIVEPPTGSVGTDIVYIQDSGEPGYVWGWAPKGAIAVSVQSAGTTATGDFLGDGMFAFWIPDAPMQMPRISVHLREGVLLSAEVGQPQLPTMTSASLDAFCRRELGVHVLTGFVESPFVVDTGTGSALLFYADGKRLLQCRVGHSVGFTQSTRGGDFDQLVSVHGERCVGYGRSPEGGQSGEVTLGGKDKVALAFQAGFYSWSVQTTGTACEATLVEIRSATRTWIMRDGKIESSGS